MLEKDIAKMLDKAESSEWKQGFCDGYQIGRLELKIELMRKLRALGDRQVDIKKTLAAEVFVEMHEIAKGPVGDRLFRRKQKKRTRG
jgi:hypothetical protein